MTSAEGGAAGHPAEGGAAGAGGSPECDDDGDCDDGEVCTDDDCDREVDHVASQQKILESLQHEPLSDLLVCFGLARR